MKSYKILNQCRSRKKSLADYELKPADYSENGITFLGLYREKINKLLDFLWGNNENLFMDMVDKLVGWIEWESELNNLDIGIGSDKLDINNFTSYFLENTINNKNANFIQQINERERILMQP